MGRDDYEHRMERLVGDLGVQIASVRARLAESPDEGMKTELARELGQLDERRQSVREKLETLKDEPDGTWADLRLQIEDEWDALIQDFEEGMASLA
ncbi:MAG: hypothetical protein M0006_08950 [Magnetospirillum sp.]|nr:hypothetical protein [Magnetospirillum sp.]